MPPKILRQMQLPQPPKGNSLLKNTSYNNNIEIAKISESIFWPNSSFYPTRTLYNFFFSRPDTLKVSLLVRQLHPMYICSLDLPDSATKIASLLVRPFLHSSWPHHHHHHTTTVLWPFFRDHPGETVPEENFWTLWCKGRLTEADTLTIRLGATPSGLISAHLHHPIFHRPDALPAAQPTVSKH